MSGPKKFGTFAGVFTPSILTILGVIMYNRMGWIVGNTGVWIVLGIIGLSHVISITTGLSISSIATDKKVGAGGVYYVLSRSLGLPIGGALGLALFVATAFSIALYMVGFAEVFNEFFEFGVEKSSDGTISYLPHYKNTLRITGSIGLLALTVLALISTSIALKAQFVILAFIILSLGSIFFGDPSNVTEFTLSEGATLTTAGFAVVFAIFFPAVTGFTAGVAMSGDLKDPKKSIPLGTMGAIAVGLVIYVGLALFLNYNISPATLIHNPKAIFELAAIGFLVYCGVWGATLSSALGGILGGPRILQAMSVDKITPKFFAKGVGKDNEPRNALIVTVIIAEIGILIGDLNVIAEVVSMFYLAAYGFINLSFFLESWASADFKPSFKIRKWVGLLGFIATFAIMAKLNMIAMIAAILIIGGIYLFLSRKQISLGSGDIWQSVWSTIVKKGLKRMEEGGEQTKNWKPNVLLFSGKTEYRSQMIEFSKAMSGQSGIITNFDLEENPNASVLFPKSKKSVQDEALEKHGIFGRHLEVQNTFKGIESIACTFGFSGIEPNTVLMPWPGELEQVEWFTSMTQKLMDLDYNILYLDYDKRWGFRKKSTIDLWWRGTGTNSELMLMIGKYLTNSVDWSQAELRVLVVNDANTNRSLIESRVNTILENTRVKANIKVVNNEVDQKPIYELMKIYSQEADLVIVGIPKIAHGDADNFVATTNELVHTIGTTLLVKASNQFEEPDLHIERINLPAFGENELNNLELPEISQNFDSNLQKAFSSIDGLLNEALIKFSQNGIHAVQEFHALILEEFKEKLITTVKACEEKTTLRSKKLALAVGLEKLSVNYAEKIEKEAEDIFKRYAESLSELTSEKERIFYEVPRKFRVDSYDSNGVSIGGRHGIRFRNALHRYWLSKGLIALEQSVLFFGYQSLLIIHDCKKALHDLVWHLLENEKSLSLEEVNENLNEINNNITSLAETFSHRSAIGDRERINELMELLSRKDYIKSMQEAFPIPATKKLKEYRLFLSNHGGHLFRNSILFGYHLEANSALLIFTTHVHLLLAELSSKWHKNLNDRIDFEFTSLSNDIQKVEKELQVEGERDIVNLQINGVSDIFLDLTADLNEFAKAVSEKTKKLPETVELIVAESLNAIGEVQNEKVLTEEVKLRDIVEFLFQTQFLDTFLAEFNLFESQLRRTYTSLQGVAATIQRKLNAYIHDQDLAGLNSSIKSISEDFENLKADTESVLAGIHREISHKQEEIKLDFDIDQIIEKIQTLDQYAQKKGQKSKLLNGLRKAGDRTIGFYERAFKFVAKKQKEKSSLAYVRKYAELISEQDVLAGFIERVSPAKSVPYAYQQMFGEGFYLGDEAFDYFQQELGMIERGIARIENNSTGAVLVLGASRSGKTALIDFAIRKFLSSKSFFINPGSKVGRNIFNESFQRATGLKGTTKEILDQLPEKSVLIFNDIEQWALNSALPYENYKRLGEIVKAYSHKHYFFFDANINAYQLIKGNTKIADSIVSTVILTSVTSDYLSRNMLKRHKDSGMNLVLNDTREAFLKDREVRKFISHVASLSGGNVGLCLDNWLASISERKENDLYFEKLPRKDFPFIKDVDLQNLIFQLFIFRRTAKRDLIRFYGRSMESWIERWINTLINASVIKVSKTGHLEIVSVARPHIEKWLNELGYTA